VRPEGLGKLKKCIQVIGSRTRYLPARYSYVINCQCKQARESNPSRQKERNQNTAIGFESSSDSGDQTLFNLVCNGVAITFKGSPQYRRRSVTQFNNTRDLAPFPKDIAQPPELEVGYVRSNLKLTVLHGVPVN
jgi:hypothetical protein